ncbi:alginate lyase family protein [Pseudomonas sp. Teo4]|uniref:alginate lyase family protein n=1 Tax=Pseudomonas sp. Teo4 TaxID=3064528 RepID=UPI002AB7F7E2|nr:alginate lyase family protein [Pseudomonas sp. Teo4]MDZ3993125.1 hypothetical protein [Pseudomonas sp. Teo4]
MYRTNRFTSLPAKAALLVLTSCAWQTAAANLVHPGILVDRAQLQYVKARLHQQPWQQAFQQAKDSVWANKAYQPKPWHTVECGSYSKPNYGCSDETNDAAAAYTQALLWSYTGETVYAENVRRILNAWANTLAGGHTNSNGPLQAAWSATQFSRALEITKYSYAQWPKAEQDKVAQMLVTQYRPNILRMFTPGAGSTCHNKNWHASGIEALMSIGIVTDNRQWMEDAIQRWRSLVPAYIYLPTDGWRPVDATWCTRSDSRIAAHWHSPKAFVTGLSQETCRDLAHTAMGLAAIVNVAETARLQGIDLYAEQQYRIIRALELHSSHQNGNLTRQLCSAPLKATINGTFEIAYNHYALRRGIRMPETQTFLAKSRPMPGGFHLRWETLTHGLTGTRQRGN